MDDLNDDAGLGEAFAALNGPRDCEPPSPEDWARLKQEAPRLYKDALERAHLRVRRRVLDRCEPCSVCHGCGQYLERADGTAQICACPAGDRFKAEREAWQREVARNKGGRPSR